MIATVHDSASGCYHPVLFHQLHRCSLVAKGETGRSCWRLQVSVVTVLPRGQEVEKALAAKKPISLATSLIPLGLALEDWMLTMPTISILLHHDVHMSDGFPRDEFSRIHIFYACRCSLPRSFRASDHESRWPTPPLWPASPCLTHLPSRPHAFITIHQPLIIKQCTASFTHVNVASGIVPTSAAARAAQLPRIIRIRPDCQIHVVCIQPPKPCSWP